MHGVSRGFPNGQTVINYQKRKGLEQLSDRPSKLLREKSKKHNVGIRVHIDDYRRELHKKITRTVQ